MAFLRRKRFWIPALLLLLAGAAYLLLRPPAPDTRFNGAYRLDDGRLVYITPREGDVLRYRLDSGESRALWPVGERRYEAGSGWAERQPVEVEVEFLVDSEDRPTGFRWEHAEFGTQTAERLDLPEEIVFFPSGRLTLRGKLVTPDAPGPHPVAVLVHGSGKESAVDTYYNPYLYAAHGIATFAYDKRGTGGSEGSYLQNFHVLSDDTVAAVEFLRSRPDIDPGRVHLAGFSQGGWIAPLAAKKDGGIQSLLIGYGPMVPITGEDRWGYVYALDKEGFGEEAIAEVDRINRVASAILDDGEDRWDELRRLLEEAEDEPWYETVRGSDSMIGFLTETSMPWWAIRLYAWWRLRPQEVAFADRTYDPVPTMEALDIPSLWIFGGEDHSMPTGWTIDELERLRARGKPIEIAVFPDADHGILEFEETEDGGRRLLGYEPGYLPLQVRWLREQSGL